MIWSLVLSAIFISYPEEILIIILTLVASGFKDSINLKNKSNLLKLMLSSSIMVLASLTVNTFAGVSFRYLINTVLFFLTIVLVYKKKPSSLILGFFITMNILVVSESLFFSLAAHITHLSYQEISSSTLYIFMLSIPDRVIQIAFLLFFCKVKNVDFKVIKPFYKDFIIVISCFLVTGCSLFFLSEKVIFSKTSSMKFMLALIINFILALIFLSLMIKRISDMRQKLYLKETQYDIELDHVKQLIQDGKSGYAIELLDQTLEQRGYYKDSLEQSEEKDELLG